MYHLDGQIAIVTGAAGGIGRAIALRLSREGAALVCGDLNGEAAEGLIRELGKKGKPGLAVQVDVTRERDVEKMIQETLGHFGRIDILVNNAGLATTGRVVECAEEDWERTLGVNLKGAFLCSRAAAREMIPRKKGRVVNIASIAGKRGVEFLGAYVSSKFGVVGLTQVLAKELGPHNITVNAVCPGYVWTPMWEYLAARFKESSPALSEMTLEEIFESRVKANTPLGRSQTPEDVAALVAFLASGEAKNITGQAINVDGGTVMH